MRRLLACLVILSSIAAVHADLSDDPLHEVHLGHPVAELRISPDPRPGRQVVLLFELHDMQTLQPMELTHASLAIRKDGTVLYSGEFDAHGTLVVPYTFAESGTYLISGRFEDDYGGFTETSFTVEVRRALWPLALLAGIGVLIFQDYLYALNRYALSTEYVQRVIVGAEEALKNLLL